VFGFRITFILGQGEYVGSYCQPQLFVKSNADGFSCLLQQRHFCREHHLEIDDNLFFKDFGGPGPSDVNVLVQHLSDQTD